MARSSRSIGVGTAEYAAQETAWTTPTTGRETNGWNLDSDQRQKERDIKNSSLLLRDYSDASLHSE